MTGLDISAINSLISDINNSGDYNIGTASAADIIEFVCLLVAAYILGLVLAYYLKRRLSHRMKRDQLTLLTRAVQIGLLFLAFAIALPGLLDLSATIIGVLAIGSLAIIGLSSQKVIANAVSGLALIYDRPFLTGDFISIGTGSGAIFGTVEGVRLFSVVIRTTSGVAVRVPNDMLYSQDISNFSTNAARRFEYGIGIRYEDDVDEAIRIIGEILMSYPFALQAPAPEVFVNDIDANSVRIKFRVFFPSRWANTQDDVSLRTAILPRVKKALEEAGIEMPYDQKVIRFFDGEAPADHGASDTGRK